MSITDELQKLEELHRNGSLSRDEFEIAKRRVLEGSSHAASSDVLADLKSQNEVAQLDREWELERDHYMVTGQYGHRAIPGKASSLFGGLFIVAFGMFWTAIAAAMTGGTGILSFFPLFGVMFILLGAGLSIRAFVKAGQYEEAHNRYQRRRAELLNKSSKN